MENNSLNPFENLSGKKNSPFFGHSETALDPSHTASMIEPSNPNLKTEWQKQNSPKPVLPSWLLPAAIGLVVILALLIIILALPKTNSSETPTESNENSMDETIAKSDEGEELNKYFAILENDPTYEPDFATMSASFSEPPTGLSCDKFQAVANMSPFILKHYLADNAVVLIADGDALSGESILVFGGSIPDATYKTATISCPDTVSVTYKEYGESELFSNISPDAHYYVWLDYDKILGE